MKPPPLHIVAIMLEMEGFGSTVTVTVNGVPLQLTDFGVTVYIAVCDVFVGFVREPFTSAAFVPAAPPSIPPVTAGAAQV